MITINEKNFLNDIRNTKDEKRKTTKYDIRNTIYDRTADGEFIK
jgi:hypothetical protein